MKRKRIHFDHIPTQKIENYTEEQIVWAQTKLASISLRAAHLLGKICCSWP